MTVARLADARWFVVAKWNPTTHRETLNTSTGEKLVRNEESPQIWSAIDFDGGSVWRLARRVFIRSLRFPDWDGVYFWVLGTPLPLFECKIFKTNDLNYDYVLDL